MVVPNIKDIVRARAQSRSLRTKTASCQTTIGQFPAEMTCTRVCRAVFEALPEVVARPLVGMFGTHQEKPCSKASTMRSLSLTLSEMAEVLQAPKIHAQLLHALLLISDGAYLQTRRC